MPPSWVRSGKQSDHPKSLEPRSHYLKNGFIMRTPGACAQLGEGRFRMNIPSEFFEIHRSSVKLLVFAEFLVRSPGMVRGLSWLLSDCP